MPNRKISICVPSWNRFQMTIDSFAQVLDDDRVAEIVLVDDASTDDSYQRLVDHFLHIPKVKVYRNDTNLDCYKNKRQSVEHSTSMWCILFDSDNILTTAYLDALYAIPEWDNHTVYQPEWARPHFDFREFSGVSVTWKNVKQYIYENGQVKTKLETALNAMNFFVNRNEYLNVWDGSVDPVTSDSIYFNYCWLKKGNTVYITPGLQYDHLVHEAHYQQNVHRTGNFHNELLKRFETMEQEIQPMALVFDIGANVGDTVYEFIRWSHKVVAFEPNPNLHTRLTKRFAGQNVLIQKCGLDNHNGTNTFKICDANSLSTFSQYWKEHSRFADRHYWDIELEVPVMTLDNAIDVFGIPDYVKIDVEGYEYEVLKGLTRLLPHTIFCFEWVEEQINDIRNSVQYIQSLGYTQFSYTENDAILLPGHIRWGTWNELELFHNDNLNAFRKEKWGMIYFRN